MEVELKNERSESILCGRETATQQARETAQASARARDQLKHNYLRKLVEFRHKVHKLYCLKNVFEFNRNSYNMSKLIIGLLNFFPSSFDRMVREAEKYAALGHASRSGRKNVSKVILA